VTLRRANNAVVQVLGRKLSVTLPLRLERPRNHPCAVRNRNAYRAAVCGGRLHQSDRELKKRGLQGQCGKQGQHRNDDYSSESKHRFHVCSPEVRWAVQLFERGKGRWVTISNRLKIKHLPKEGNRISWLVRHGVFPAPQSITLQGFENRPVWALLLSNAKRSR
jgi:hypothetical protein